MPAPSSNEKLAAATDHGELNLVFSTTLSIPLQKDQDSALIFPFAAHFKLH